MVVIAVSLLPAIIAWLRSRRKNRRRVVGTGPCPRWKRHRWGNLVSVVVTRKGGLGR